MTVLTFAIERDIAFPACDKESLLFLFKKELDLS